MAVSDSDVMISALKKERDIAHQKVMQLDRIIKQVREGKYLANTGLISEATDNKKKDNKEPQFPKNAEIKIQVLSLFDIVAKAVKLQVIQDEYDRLNGHHYPVRDTMRSLQNSKLLVMIREKAATRGFLWAKAEWIENGQLLDIYKPEGFDLLYKPDNLEYE